MADQSVPVISRHRSKAWEQVAAWGLFVVLAYFPIFLDLDAMPLRIWDESRQAVNAYEMAQNGDWLVKHFQGKPDMWNTKPPLLVWSQALLMKVLGPAELAVRLPAAVSAFLTGLLLMWVAARWLERPWLGLVACLVLFTSQGYLHHHAARHGDHDAPVTFFMLLQVIALFRYVTNGSRRSLVYFFVGLGGAVLTKSIQGLLFLPALAVFILYSGSWRSLVRERATWFGLGAVLCLVAGYYAASEQANPGYIDAVISNELGQRYNTVSEGHAGDWDFYVSRIIRQGLTSFHLLVPVGLILALSFQDDSLRRWGLLVGLVAVSYLTIISNSTTKCEWYDVPMYPMLAMLAAFPLYMVLEWLREQGAQLGSLRWNVLPGAFLFLVFVGPWSRETERVYRSEEWEWDRQFYAPAHYFKQVLAGERQLKAGVLTADGPIQHLVFYMDLMRERGRDIRVVPSSQLVPGMTVLAYEASVQEMIEREHLTRVLEDWGSVRTYEILDQEWSSEPEDTRPS